MSDLFYYLKMNIFSVFKLDYSFLIEFSSLKLLILWIGSIKIQIFRIDNNKNVCFLIRVKCCEEVRKLLD